MPNETNLLPPATCRLPMVLQEVTSRVDAAFNTTGYSLVSDNEHVTYIAPSLHKQLAAMVPPTSKQLEEASSRNSGAC